MSHGVTRPTRAVGMPYPGLTDRIHRPDFTSMLRLSGLFAVPTPAPAAFASTSLLEYAERCSLLEQHYAASAPAPTQHMRLPST